MRSSKYTILIICEGEKTEPLFFNSIRDRIKDGKIDIGDNVEITLRPEPKTDSEEAEETNEHRAYKRKKRQTRKVEVEPLPIPGIPPLKWVEEGHRELKDGTFNEVWAVFDKDQHPRAKEAFELAEKEVDGRYVNIAFTSICFEYYLLLHFEKIYYDFEKSECHEKCKETNKEIYFQCGTHIHPKDCNGFLCINGYARKNNYWEGRKNNSSVYDIIENYLYRGFVNAEWIRFVSDKLNKNKPIYLRNPYLTIDALVKRLVGETKEWKFIGLDEVIAINREIEFSVHNNKTIQIRNISKKSILIPANSFEILSFSPDKTERKGDRILLNKGDEETIIVSTWNIDKKKTILFDYDNNKIVFDFSVDYKNMEYSNVMKKLTYLNK
ncbi:MAG: RloB family protein [Tannerellaceae bacterium]|nr:RloB family protein [Tannerellaceae bacterium]